MSVPLRLLLVEDNPNDAVLIIRELRNAGFNPTYDRVETESDYTALLGPHVDVVLSDFELPQFSGAHALALLQERGLNIPFLVISGAIGEETAVWMMQLGAADYLLKDRLTRLGPALERALAHARNVELQKLEDAAARDTQRRFSALTEHLPQVLWLANERGERSYVSPAYDTVWGRDRDGSGRPTGMLEGVYIEDRERVRDALQAMVNDGKFDITYRVVHPQAGVRVVRDRGARMRDIGRGDARFVGSADDVTFRHQREEVARQHQQLQFASRLSRVVGDRLNALVHVATRGLERLAQARQQDPAVDAWLSDLQLAAIQAGQPLAQLNAFTGRRPTGVCRVDLAHVLASSHSAMSRVVGGHLVLGRSVASMEVYASHDMMVEMFIEAARWLRATLATGGGARIEFARTTLGPNSNVRAVAVRVVRDGITESESEREHVFEPFAQTLRPPSSSYAGGPAGEGLAALHGIVRQHRGMTSLTVTSIGETTLEILLPEATADSVPPDEDEPLPEDTVLEERVVMVR